MPDKSRARSKRPSRQTIHDLDVKISFLEGVVRRDARFVQALELLGDHYTKRGRYAQSLKVDQQLSELEPHNPMVFYNLACSYSLNSELDAAVAALDRAISLGYRDFNWLAKDPDLRQLRKHPLYRTIKAKIRMMRIRISS